MIDLYAEGIDTIQYFLSTNDSLILLRQNTTRQGYIYLPTTYLTAKITNADVKSIQIIGKSKDKNRKLIVGRLNGSKKIRYIADNMKSVDTFVSKYAFEKQSDTFVDLPGDYLRLHGFNWRSRLILNDCYSSHDSIRCISQFANKILDEYALYDVYGINKQELINRNTSLAETNNIDIYYRGLKEIIASLNSCHIRLATDDDNESPLQPIYFHKINDKIDVSAIFAPILNDKIQLDDQLLSINNISLNRLYEDFSKTIFASTTQQREIKITQKLLYMANEIWRDSLLLEFQNKTNKYSVCLDKSNFSGKKVVPKGFKIVNNNVIVIRMFSYVIAT